MTTTSSTRSGENARGLPAIALCGTATTMDYAEAAPANVAAQLSRPAPDGSPDALLLALGRAWVASVKRCAELDALSDEGEQASASRTAARLMADVLRRRIIAAPALTIAGLEVKALVPGAMFDA